MIGEILCTTAILTVSANPPAQPANPVLDDHGVREFSPVPPPGVHPRIFLSPEDIPDLRYRVYETEYGRKVSQPIMEQVRRRLSDMTEHYPMVVPEELDRATVEELFRPDEGRNQHWGVLAIDGFLREDASQKRHLIHAIVGYCHVILASKRLMPDHTLWDLGKPGESNWNLQHEWAFGGEGLAITYDFLHGDMSEEQRSVVRQAIATILAGRRSWGLGWPQTKLFSNWVPLHGDMLTLALAIEGEAGYEPQLYDLWAETLEGWFTAAIAPSGSNHEDGYVYYALRGGLPAALAMARRGDNLFYHPHFHRLFEWQLHWDPVYGNYDGFYQNIFVCSKYAMPEDPLINFFWRKRTGPNYEYRQNWQNFTYAVLLGMDYFGDADRSADPAQFGMPLSYFCPRRGVMLARNGWDASDLLFKLHARSDSMFVGHAAVDAGAFELQAHGCEWVHHNVGDKAGSFSSKDFSLVHIDGMAQRMKPPMVKTLYQTDTEAAVMVIADLTYAYNWQWYYGWPKPSGKQTGEDGNQAGHGLPGPPWEPERNDPYDLGWPAEESWMPHDISDQPDLAFDGLWQYKQRINRVEHAYRTAVVVRGEHPYVLLVDDVKQDQQERLYEWFMQTPTDVALVQMHRNDIVLGEETEEQDGGFALPGSRRLLLRFVAPFADMPETFGPMYYHIPGYLQDARLEDHLYWGNRDGKRAAGRRLVVPVRATEGSFKVLLFPFLTTIAAQGKERDAAWREEPAGGALPETAWNADHTELTVQIGGQTDVFHFTVGEEGRTRLTLTRDGDPILQTPSSPRATD